MVSVVRGRGKARNIEVANPQVGVFITSLSTVLSVCTSVSSPPMLYRILYSLGEEAKFRVSQLRQVSFV